jgi:hypothetical protein
MSYDRRAYILHQKDFFDTNSLPQLMTMARKKNQPQTDVDFDKVGNPVLLGHIMVGI